MSAYAHILQSLAGVEQIEEISPFEHVDMLVASTAAVPVWQPTPELPVSKYTKTANDILSYRP